MKKKVIDPIGTLIGFLLFAGAMSTFALPWFYGIGTLLCSQWIWLIVSGVVEIVLGAVIALCTGRE